MGRYIFWNGTEWCIGSKKNLENDRGQFYTGCAIAVLDTLPARMTRLRGV